MTEQVDTGRRRTLALYAWIAVPVILLGGVLVATMFRGGRPDDPTRDKDRNARTEQENHLATARSTLARENDLTTCRTVVSHLNNHLRERPAGTPLDPKFVSDLKAQLLRQEREVRERQLDRKLEKKEEDEIASLV